MTDRLWVAELFVSARTATKIWGVHRIDPGEVYDELVCRSRLVYEWDDDEERGLRAIVTITIRAKPAVAVLYPARNSTQGDRYHLGSAYHLA